MALYLLLIEIIVVPRGACKTQAARALRSIRSKKIQDLTRQLENMRGQHQATVEQLNSLIVDRDNALTAEKNKRKQDQQGLCRIEQYYRILPMTQIMSELMYFPTKTYRILVKAIRGLLFKNHFMYLSELIIVSTPISRVGRIR